MEEERSEIEKRKTRGRVGKVVMYHVRQTIGAWRRGSVLGTFGVAMQGAGRAAGSPDGGVPRSVPDLALSLFAVNSSVFSAVSACLV